MGRIILNSKFSLVFDVSFSNSKFRFSNSKFRFEIRNFVVQFEVSFWNSKFRFSIRSFVSISKFRFPLRNFVFPFEVSFQYRISIHFHFEVSNWSYHFLANLFSIRFLRLPQFTILMRQSDSMLIPIYFGKPTSWEMPL